MTSSVRPRVALVAATLAAAGVAGFVAAPAGSAAAAPSPLGGSIVPVSPLRVLDTRTSSPGGVTSGIINATPALPDMDPNDVTAVLVNVTVVNATGSGYVRLGNGSGTSNGNYVAKAPSANLALVPVQHSVANPVSVSFAASTRIDLTADVQGYVLAGDASADVTSTFTPVGPTRIADSRKNLGLHRLASNQTQKLEVVGDGDVVPAAATAVVANVTVVKPTAQTYVTAWSGSGNRPVVSTLNATAGSVVANRAVLPLDEDGTVSLYNYAGSGDVVVDVVGYLSGDHSGSYYVPADAATRLTDHTGTRITLTPAIDEPAGYRTTAVWVTLAGVGPTGGYLTSGQTVTLPATTSDLNMVSGRAVANAGPVQLSDTGSFSVAAVPSSRFVVDLGGWFQQLVD